MALKGTIKDFGIADIFQLIGQQAKTGVLLLKTDHDEVRVYFQSGSVVRAESSTRPQSQLLGSMMVEADLLTAAELAKALEEQARTLKKIGTELVELDLASATDVRDFAHLQMTDTVYSLFTWQSGTYEFEQTDSVPIEEGGDPIRAESLLMEGLRMIDEWPVVRQRLPSQQLIPEKIKPLPDEAELNPEMDVFGIGGGGAPATTAVDVGPTERRVFSLLQTGRTVQQLVHLSRLGEFETCRAILTLIDGGYVRLVEPKPPEVEPPSPWRPTTLLLRVAACSVLAGVALVMVSAFDGRQVGLDIGSTMHYRESHFEGYLAETQLDVIRRALDVFRLQTGSYPDALEPLAEAGLLRERDLRFPFVSSYYYRRDGSTYVLMPPLY